MGMSSESGRVKGNPGSLSSYMASGAPADRPPGLSVGGTWISNCQVRGLHVLEGRAVGTEQVQPINKEKPKLNQKPKIRTRIRI